MAGNSGFKSGSVSYASKDKQMAAYDALPKSIREAMANAAFNWAPYPVKQRFERLGRGAPYWVEIIKRWDAEQIAKDRTRVWGLPPEPNGRRAVRR